MGPQLHLDEGLLGPHNRILWERSQQKHTLARPSWIGPFDTSTSSAKAAGSAGQSHALFGEDLTADGAASKARDISSVVYYIVAAFVTAALAAANCWQRSDEMPPLGHCQMVDSLSASATGPSGQSGGSPRLDFSARNAITPRAADTLG